MTWRLDLNGRSRKDSKMMQWGNHETSRRSDKAHLDDFRIFLKEKKIFQNLNHLLDVKCSWKGGIFSPQKPLQFLRRSLSQVGIGFQVAVKKNTVKISQYFGSQNARGFFLIKRIGCTIQVTVSPAFNAGILSKSLMDTKTRFRSSYFIAYNLNFLPNGHYCTTA